MKDQVLEVKWVRADVSPEEADRRLKAAFKLILEAQRQAAPVSAESTDGRRREQDLK
jgi:hypothetical protein